MALYVNGEAVTVTGATAPGAAFSVAMAVVLLFVAIDKLDTVVALLLLVVVSPDTVVALLLLVVVRFEIFVVLLFVAVVSEEMAPDEVSVVDPSAKLDGAACPPMRI